jgi:hypothetical protein
VGTLLTATRRVHHAALLLVLFLGTAFGAAVLAAAWGQRRVVAEHWQVPWVPVLAALAAGVVGGALVLARRAVAWHRGRWSSVSLAPWRGLLVIGTATAAVYLAFLQPFKPLFWGITVALGFGVYAWLLAAWPAIGERLPRRLVRGADLVLFLAAFVPLTAELALRLHAVLWPSTLTYQVDLQVPQLVERNRMPPGRVRMGFPLDERGFYDVRPAPPPRPRPLVGAIGDSFSLGVVPHEYHFTTVCERELPGVEVYNAGVVGVGPPGYLVLLREDVLELAPDVLLINLFVGNDVVCEGQYGEGKRQLRVWFDRNNLMLATVPQRWARLRRERAALGADMLTPEGPLPGERLTLQEMLPWLEDPLLEPPRSTPERYVEMESFRAHLACRPDQPVYGPLFRTLRELVETAGATPIGFVLIPDEFQVEEELWQAILASRPDEVLERDLPQRRITAWLDEHDLPYLDLLPLLRSVEPLEDGRRHVYHLRDTHFNARGNEVAGRAMAAFLRTAFGLGS